VAATKADGGTGEGARRRLGILRRCIDVAEGGNDEAQKILRGMREIKEGIKASDQQLMTKATLGRSFIHNEAPEISRGVREMTEEKEASVQRVMIRATLGVDSSTMRRRQRSETFWKNSGWLLGLILMLMW